MLFHNLFDPIVNQLGFQEKLTSQRETGDTLRVGHKLCIICWVYAVVRNSLIHSNDIIQVLKIRQSKINSRLVAGPMGQMNRRPSV